MTCAHAIPRAILRGIGRAILRGGLRGIGRVRDHVDQFLIINLKDAVGFMVEYLHDVLFVHASTIPVLYFIERIKTVAQFNAFDQLPIEAQASKVKLLFQLYDVIVVGRQAIVFEPFHRIIVLVFSFCTKFSLQS